MDYAIIARRMTILVLVMALFAIAFAALVQKAPRPGERLRIGANAPCYHPATQGCVGPVRG